MQSDVYGDEAALAELLASHRFEAVVDFIAYTVRDVPRDIRLFREKMDKVEVYDAPWRGSKLILNFKRLKRTGTPFVTGSLLHANARLPDPFAAFHLQIFLKPA